MPSRPFELVIGLIGDNERRDRTARFAVTAGNISVRTDDLIEDELKGIDGALAVMEPRSSRPKPSTNWRNKPESLHLTKRFALAA